MNQSRVHRVTQRLTWVNAARFVLKCWTWLLGLENRMKGFVIGRVVRWFDCILYDMLKAKYYLCCSVLVRFCGVSVNKWLLSSLSVFSLSICTFITNLISSWMSMLGKVCQMLSWLTKNSLHFISIWDIIINVVPLCSVYQALSYESNLTLLAWFQPEIAYLSMLFILGVVFPACSADHLKNK